jgi:hypothetical protein
MQTTNRQITGKFQTINIHPMLLYTIVIIFEPINLYFIPITNVQWPRKLIYLIYNIKLKIVIKKNMQPALHRGCACCLLKLDRDKNVAIITMIVSIIVAKY